MENLLIFVFGIVVGFCFYKILGGNKPTSFLRKNRASQEELEGRKNEILKFVKNKGKITNKDVENMFGVSDPTATRYLQKLENDKKIKQVGEVGQGVYYELI